MTHRINSFDEYKEQYEKSVTNPESFWAEVAETFSWYKKWDQVLEWDFRKPAVKWFKNAKLNITENCLDRHLETRPDQTAIIFEPNDPEAPVQKFTYRELHLAVCRAANALKANGIKKGDRVCFYMPMVPELAIGVLACARIGAVHSVVFAGFSAQALADRIKDASCKMVICSDFNNRGAKHIPVKNVVDDALKMDCDSIETVLVHRNTGDGIEWTEGRDKWWHEEVDPQSGDCPAEVMDAEDMLFILYTSGSTGKPKGVVHTCGGYMVYTTYSFKNVFQYREGDVYWCTADIGWITGHSYIVYGPLAAGATTVMFEGVPTYPHAGRFWEVVEKHKVNQFYTAPTAIRALMAFGDEPVKKYDLTSLRILGSVGEPINEEAWNWYHETVGNKGCPIVDTWWQTETGGIMISGLGGLSPMKPAHAGYPLPGVQLCLVDNEGVEIEGNDVEGLLCVKFPWPSILRTTYGDHERCRTTYFAMFEDKYFTGDGARRDENGMYRIIGRVDDVLNVSGHRMGTAEVENAINEHPKVVESAVVGYPHDIKGQGIYAYVITTEEVSDEDAFAKEVRDVVTREIGPIAKPDRIQVVSGLPKTRSGKIMRRILRKVASGDTSNLGDTSTLLNPEIVEEIKSGAKQ
ncbi:acetate--CoA ligase [Flavilitoribacter nigricans]|uniref:Acetate--CoA ligase n=1 Tax=Flavilitoribacter nigricans (strain ATCC 23147 / DSM 23189 / NBRC 102662 / NCIMB 1420 / SS-2) TaxID=1122177 RepID=A0A2D0N2Q9_FLAN2|nr:acetate--CoA ligase [Flavilitoribacter nigricans]PHN02678.1 acetate--CoA ligase [Flavilitoribacter nigricans DSM 23189 = NBRC 102662]